MLRCKSCRPQQQQDRRHAEQPRPRCREQFFRFAHGHQRHHLADEDWNHHVEQRHRKSDREQAEEEGFRLAGEMPIERDQSRRRLGAASNGSGFQRSLKKAEHRNVNLRRTRHRGVPRGRFLKGSIRRRELVLQHVQTVASTIPLHYALAYLPRPKKRSFWSSLALSRTDFSWPTCARARLTASRAAILSTHVLIVGYLPGSMASNSKLRSHGHAAMSAMV